MAMKRLLSSDTDDEPSREQKRPLLSPGTVLSTWSASYVESFFRKPLREEAENAVKRFTSNSRPSSNHSEAPGATGPQLRVIASLAESLDTQCRITPITVVIVNGNTEEKETSGRLSSVRVEIVVLDGDFGKDEYMHWTRDDFNKSIVRERVGKRPLLVGDVFVQLREGTVTISNLTFTDNSSRMKSRKFRLGVRVVGKNDIVERIREGMSKPFIVKEYRGESNKKHDSPSMKDEVWRLKNIGKEYSTRLADKGIKTVQQFLQLLKTDPNRLRQILGRMSRKEWEETKEHAQKCKSDDRSPSHPVPEKGNHVPNIHTDANSCELPSLNLMHPMDQQSENRTAHLQQKLTSASAPRQQLSQAHCSNFNTQAVDQTQHENNANTPDFQLSQSLFPIQNNTLDELLSLNSMLLMNQLSETRTVHLQQEMTSALAQSFPVPPLAQAHLSNFNALVADQTHQENNANPPDFQLSQSLAPTGSSTFGFDDYGNEWDWRETQSSPSFGQVIDVVCGNVLNALNPDDGISRSLGVVKPKPWLKLGVLLKWEILGRAAARRMAEPCM